MKGMAARHHSSLAGATSVCVVNATRSSGDTIIVDICQSDGMKEMTARHHYRAGATLVFVVNATSSSGYYTVVAIFRSDYVKEMAARHHCRLWLVRRQSVWLLRIIPVVSTF